jgi:hypothetical protein
VSGICIASECIVLHKRLRFKLLNSRLAITELIVTSESIKRYSLCIIDHVLSNDARWQYVHLTSAAFRNTAKGDKGTKEIKERKK